MLTNLKHFFIGGIVAGLVIVFFLFIDGYDSVLMSKIQTRFYPVMGPFKITKTSDVIGGTMFSGCAERLRPECTAWRKTVWYLGSRGRGVFLTDDPHGDPPQVREGRFLCWDRMFVPVTPQTLRQNTYADAYHACNGDDRPLVRSEFFDPAPAHQ